MKRLVHLLMTLALVASSWLAAAGTPGAETITLDIEQAVSIAVARNPLIISAGERVRSARFKRDSARADFFPRLTAGYRYTGLSKEPYIVAGGGMRAQVAHANQHHWDLTLVQPLFTGFAVSTRYAMAGLGIDIGASQQKRAILDVTLGAKKACYDVLLTGKLLRVTGDALHSLAAHEKEALRFYERGVIRLNDLLRARVAMAGAVQEQERASAAAGMATAALNRWLDADINRETRVRDIAAVSNQESASLEEAMQEGLAQRPLLGELRLSAEILDRVVTLEKRGFLPTLALFGGYEQEGDAPRATNNDFSNSHNSFVGIEASWTLFDGLKTRANVHRARADRRALKETIRDLEAGIRLEVKDAWLDTGVMQKNIVTAKTALTQAEENMRITRLGYRQQAVTSTEVLDARTDLTAAQTRYYQALYGAMTARARLDRAMGHLPPP